MDVISRREMLMGAGALAVGALARGALAQGAGDAAGAAGGNGKRILFYTRSQGYPHAVVTRKPGEPLAFAERQLKEWGESAGYAVEVTKDGSLFTPAFVERFDAFVFYTSGVLTDPPLPKGARWKSDQTPGMTAEGKAAFLRAIENGKGFVGMHSASDTCENPAHQKDAVKFAPKDLAGAGIDPYCQMLGAEFTSHASQQKARIAVAPGANAFPGLEGLRSFEKFEEWYAYTNLRRDMQVLLIQETDSMAVDPKTGKRPWQYAGPNYPETWVRQQGKGRVFYTGMGHREDVWTSAEFRQLVMAGIAWASGVTQFKVKPNAEKVCPGLG